MKFPASVRFVTACAFGALVALGFAYVSAGGTDPRSPAAAAAVPQPDIDSSNWKPISDDLGVWVVKSDRGGMRGRLFVRTGTSWSPVAVDGEADILGLIPVRK